MKRLSSILAAAIFLGTTVPRAQAEVSVDFFHDQLESSGDWREVGSYGYCWQPRDVDANWRPYGDGRWLYTDAGWTWDSDEPYSWAVYHYGRWARVDRVGWVWVPGTEWGPAWVSWRRSPQYVGWAPLPPDAQFSRSVGFNTRVDADYDIGPTNYNFVEVRNFGAPRLRTVIVAPQQNITIISQTTNITRITYVNNVVYNEGPQYDAISRESAQPIRRLTLERREQLDGDPNTVHADQLRTRVEGNSLRVLALPFDTKPATAPRKVAARVENADVDHGWKNAGPPAEVAKMRTKIKSEPAAPAEPQAAQPKVDAAASAETKPGAIAPPVSSQDEKSAKAKAKSAAARAASAVVPQVDPVKPDNALSVDKPVAPEPAPSAGKPGKLGKVAKPVNPEANRLPVSPPDAGTPEQPQARKGKNPAIETAPPPAEAPMRKKESVEPSGNQPPTAAETPRQKLRPGKGDAPPKPEPPVEREAPNAPESRPLAKKPEAHQPAAPGGTQPQPAKAKAKGGEKDEKKDGAKPEGAPQ